MAEEEVGSHAGTLDLTSGQVDHAAHPDSSHRYSGPMVQQYKYPVVGFIVILALTITAIALGASSLAKSNEALALATANEEAIVQTAEMMIQLEQSAADDPPLITVPSAPSGVVVTPAVTPPPTTPKPTTQQPTDAPTITHPLNPKWYHTDHDKYQNIMNAEMDGEKINAEHHSHLLAGLFCMQNDKDLCPLDVYCPNGQGSPPYLGGPPKSMGWEEKQWAPYKTADVTAGSSNAGGTWVQVGKIPEVDGGMDENGFGQCWTWDGWMNSAGGDIEDVWGEEHRSWILCCDMAEQGNGN